MKVLVIGWRDSANLNMLNVLCELERRGHQLTIFEYYSEKANNWMLQDLNAEFRSSDELTPEIAKGFDIAFCAHDMADVLYLDIYCFSFNWQGVDYITASGGDFLFTTYSSPKRLDRQFQCGSMAVGTPKNDTITVRTDTKRKRILYIDPGHLPFGHTGKVQLADMVLQICSAFPEYELCIKPRWLLSDVESDTFDYTHKNAEHIYTVIKERCHGAIPNNLNMLQEHLDLQELIDSSISVITAYSSASCDVILRNRGLLIISGFDCDETYEVRPFSFERACEHYIGSGCVVDYRDVAAYLPEGLRAETSYIQKYFPYKGSASKRMVDVMEYVYDQFLSQGVYPAMKAYTYESYCEEMSVDPTITMASLKRERIRNICLATINDRSVCSKILSESIDFSEFYAHLEKTYKDCPVTKDGFTAYQAELKCLEARIMDEQRELWEGMPFEEEYWLRMLWEGRAEDELLAIPEIKITNKIAYHYFLGRVCRKRKMVNEAMAHFYRFIKLSPILPYTRYYSEHDRSFHRAYTYLISNYDGNNLTIDEFIDVCQSIYERRCKNLLNEDICAKMLHALGSIGEKLEPEYKKYAVVYEILHSNNQQ